MSSLLSKLSQLARGVVGGVAHDVFGEGERTPVDKVDRLLQGSRKQLARLKRERDTSASRMARAEKAWRDAEAKRQPGAAQLKKIFEDIHALHAVLLREHDGLQAQLVEAEKVARTAQAQTAQVDAAEQAQRASKEQKPNVQAAVDELAERKARLEGRMDVVKARDALKDTNKT